MGWKSVKQHYGIEHIVHVTRKGMCIGSGYIHDLIVINADGEITKVRDSIQPNEKLGQYVAAFKADRELLRSLIAKRDEFERSIPVYTYDGGNIIEKHCEDLGWPNVTHDGELMYENTHYANKLDAVRKAKANASAAVSGLKRRVAEVEQHLVELNGDVAKYAAAVRLLDAEYPGVEEIV